MTVQRLKDEARGNVMKHVNHILSIVTNRMTFLKKLKIRRKLPVMPFYTIKIDAT